MKRGWCKVVAAYRPPTAGPDDWPLIIHPPVLCKCLISLTGTFIESSRSTCLNWKVEVTVHCGAWSKIHQDVYRSVGRIAADLNRIVERNSLRQLRAVFPNEVPKCADVKHFARNKLRFQCLL